MNLSKDNVILSAIIAGIPTGIEILHKKFGGLLSGGNYSASHSWQEMFGMIPYFIAIFVGFFVGACAYFDYRNNK